MPNNALLTGPPRSGKTTVLEGLVDRLESRDCRAGGVYCPERRIDGERIGFDVVDVSTGEKRTLASVDRTEGPSVGKYRVNVAGVDAVCSAALAPDVEADALVVDEIAPMQAHSEAFVEGVRRALDDERPLVAAVHGRSTAGFIGEVKDRADAERRGHGGDARRPPGATRRVGLRAGGGGPIVSIATVHIALSGGEIR